MCGRPARPASSRALHHLNDGRAWPVDEVASARPRSRPAGLDWAVVESIIVHEDIKTRTGRYRELIDNYKASIRAVAAAGINTVCYNFMAITDWTRTDLDYPMPHGGTALRFDIVEFCAYDVLVLKRDGAEADHPAERIEAARKRLAAMSESELATAGAQPDRLGAGARIHLRPREFPPRARSSTATSSPRVSATTCSPSCARSCRWPRRPASSMAIHPDDPPFPIFGLPRVVSSADDARALLAAVRRRRTA